MSSNKIVQKNNSGSSSYWEIDPVALSELSNNVAQFKAVQIPRLYCGYGGNTSETVLTQNVWTRFAYPSGGFTVYRQHDFTVDPSLSRFTYIGANPKWIRIDAVCNLLKGTGGNVSRTIEFQWYVNGSPVGFARKSHMNNLDSQIISGTGELLLNNGDYIEPFIRNTENADNALLENCTFQLSLDPEYVWGA